MGKEWDGGDIAFRVETWSKVLRILKPGGHLVAFNHSRTWHRMAVAIEDAGFEIRDSRAWLYGTGFPKSHDVSKAIDKLHGPGTAAARAWDGWGSALKPAFEPIVLARKPLAESSIARQVLATGTGALHINAARIGGGEVRTLNGIGNRRASQSIGTFKGKDPTETTLGRWPANVLHDGSREVLATLPIESPGGPSVARLFYSAKANDRDRRGSNHPTVKPQELMQWLVRLVCARGGRILDPFGGSGSTGWAAAAEGVNCDLIERESEYQADILRGIAALEAETAPSSTLAADALPGQLALF